jgi:hypothetical protein
MQKHFVLLCLCISGLAEAHSPKSISHLDAATASVPYPAETTAPYEITVDARTSHVLNRFSPLVALGAGVDGVITPAVPEIYTAANVAKLLGAGFGPVTYRLYTELSVQDWHWNPSGSFSSAGQGYWISSAVPAKPTANTYGYRLPRRGFTHKVATFDGKVTGVTSGPAQ